MFVLISCNSSVKKSKRGVVDMKAKILGIAIVVAFVLTFTSLVPVTASENKAPEVLGSLTYDPVTLHANIVDIHDIDEVKIYFRYREKDEEEWTETEKRIMEEEGKYSRVLDDVDPENKYEFEVVVEWDDDKLMTFSTEPRPAEFEISDLRAEPEKLYIGDHTKLKVDVENTGGQEGSTEVDFIIDGTIVSEEVELGPGERKTVSASYVPEEEGKYEAKVDSQSVVFEAFELPSIRAESVTDVTHSSAVLTANVESLGIEDEINIYFKYRAENEDWRKTPKEVLESEGEYTRKIEGLEPDTTYEFKAVGVWDDKRYTTKERFQESKTIPVEPKAFVEEKTRGVNDIGVLFLGEGMSLDSEIIEYRWDFYDDGEWDYKSNETGKTVYAYEETGEYEAVFEVEDAKGKTGSATVSVHVRQRKQPIYEIVEESEASERDVHFKTNHHYDEELDETTISINVKNNADVRRDVSITLNIPKDAISSFEEMETYPNPTEILEENPRVVWNFTLPGDETARIEVSSDGYIEPEMFDGMKMVQVYETEEELKIRTVTGLITRGVRRIWGFIAIVVIAVVVVLLLVGKKQRKSAFDSLAKIKKSVEKKDDDEKESKKEEFDEKLIETARKAKEAVRENRVSDPRSLVRNLERANEALERGEFGRFEQHLHRTENEMNCSVMSNNVVS